MLTEGLTLGQRLEALQLRQQGVSPCGCGSLLLTTL